MQGDIQQNLPWLANGTLDAEERARLEALIAGSAEARKALDWELAMRDAIQAETAEWEAPSNTMDLVFKRIEAARPRAKESAIKVFFAGIMQSFQASPKFAFACAVAAVQFGVIGYLWSNQEDPSAYSEMRSTQPALQPTKFIRVMFAPNSTESDLRELLRKAGAEIVAGPSQLGDYYLLVDAEKLTSTVAALRTNTKIESAEIVNALPAKP